MKAHVGRVGLSLPYETPCLYATPPRELVSTSVTYGSDPDTRTRDRRPSSNLVLSPRTRHPVTSGALTGGALVADVTTEEVVEAGDL